jgi:hypothetical protein
MRRINSALNLRISRPATAGLLAPAIALLFAAFGASAQAEVVSPHVVGPTTVTPHVVTAPSSPAPPSDPTPSAEAPAEPPPPPPASPTTGPEGGCPPEGCVVQPTPTNGGPNTTGNDKTLDPYPYQLPQTTTVEKILGQLFCPYYGKLMTDLAGAWNAKVDAMTATPEDLDQIQRELEQLSNLQRRYCFTTRTP